MNSTTSQRPAIQEAQPVGLSTGNTIVDSVTQMRFEGNIVDHRWFLCDDLRHKSGLINGAAIHVLADIVFWHTAILDREHATQVVTAARPRFSGKEFWQSYEIWARGLGLTVRQLRDAVAFLHSKKIIKRRSGQIKLASGVKTNNVAIITLNVEKLHEITYGTASPRHTKREAPHVETGDAQRSNGTRPTPQREITNIKHADNTQKPTTTDEVDFLILSLCSLGVSKARATTLAKTYPEEMQNRLKWLDFIPDVKSPAALLSARPGETWTEPASARRQREAENAEAESAAQQRADANKRAQQKEQEKEKEAENKMLDEHFEQLDAADQSDIEQEAQQKVSRLKAAGFQPRGALDAARRNIMRRNLGLPVEDLSDD
jgi:hypothetical protein